MSALPVVPLHSQHQKTLGRDIAVQFLYQCECERMFYFPGAQFDEFVEHFQIPPRGAAFARELVSGTLNDLPRWDQLLDSVSRNWRVERMPVIDRTILRLATYELQETDTPTNVVVDEAIELAKKYGAENSARFVNGILDQLARMRG